LGPDLLGLIKLYILVLNRSSSSEGLIAYNTLNFDDGFKLLRASAGDLGGTVKVLVNIDGDIPFSSGAPSAGIYMLKKPEPC